MNTSKENLCRNCGAVVPAKTTEELCPACLMSGVLGSQSRAETLSDTSSSTLAPWGPKEFPCKFGEYHLLRLLGRGGMGTVYEAEEIATGRRVALKMLGQQLDSPDLRQRFLREGRLAAGVNHPNSLYVFGSEEIDGTPVITMEIAGGGTLKDRLERRGPLPVAEAVDAVLDVIAGLETAFQAGILHRDIKPSNCFVNPDGSVKIGDFGLSVSTLAKDDSYVTVAGAIMGTPAFASPEQLRGDELDVRADVYSVGATLYTLLTGKAPFEGKNAAQVVANAVNRKPQPTTQLRPEVPPELDRIVNRCLAKEAEQRYEGYKALRTALLPFSSKEPEPASMAIRAPAAWIDYLLAFLIPYVALMMSIGNDEFHLRFFMDRTLYSARHYLAFLGFGFLYFALAEGIWGAGLGKYLKGLSVIRSGGRRVGVGRALLRVLIPVLSIEIVRVPFLMATLSATQINDMTTVDIVLYSAATFLCPWIPALLSLRVRRETGYVTFWDYLSGTRVVHMPEGASRLSVATGDQASYSAECGDDLGPYKIIEKIDPGNWIAAIDPVLRRRVWLRRRTSPELSRGRRGLARQGRLRWLQEVETEEATWDAYEAIEGISFSSLTKGCKPIPWSTLRLWLHDLASELWAASNDQTLPISLSAGHVWIAKRGRAVLLDERWPRAEPHTEAVPAEDLSGQQRFLNSIATHVDLVSLPLHARPVLKNLKDGRFERLSFLTGTLQGLLSKPAEMTRGIRAGSIFMLPLYVGIMLFVGTYQGAHWLYAIVGNSTQALLMTTALAVLGGSAVIQLLSIPFRTTFGQLIFRLAVLNQKGERASRSTLLARWAITWLPLLIPISLVALFITRIESGLALAILLGLILTWLAAAVYSVLNPNRGLHDRIAGTWVVRQ